MAVAATPTDVTVTILRFIQVDDPDPYSVGGGDYYAYVKIGNTPSIRQPGDGDVSEEDFSPYWAFTRTVDPATYPNGLIPITIEVWDGDPGDDDIIDLSPIDNDQILHLIFNPITHSCTGDTTIGYSVGDNDHEYYDWDQGGEAGKIFFGITTSSNIDTDEDGIPDAIELYGIRDADGNMVADMAALGADPCRKTIAVEIDSMVVGTGHSHTPDPAAITQAVNMFNDATLVPAVTTCPYAGFPTQANGINLVVDVDGTITEQNPFGCSDFSESFKAANFNPAKKPYFHYNLWVHDWSAKYAGSSGVACGGSKDFIVSLGGWGGPNQNGHIQDQAGTFVHELGHQLGLGHGGGDGINFKPNYISVMNYLWQAVGITNTATGANYIDYSWQELPQLDETNLNELAGVSDGPLLTHWWDLSFTETLGSANSALDWTGNDANGDGTVDNDASVGVDLNGDRVCVKQGADGTWQTSPAGDDVIQNNMITDGPDRICDTSAASGDVQEGLLFGHPNRPAGNKQETILKGYNDWMNIRYRAVLSPTASGGMIEPHSEMTYADAQLIKASWMAALTPDLTLEKTVDSASAIPGDLLTYKVKVTNSGTGTATAIKLVDTLPDGTTNPRTLADLAAGASKVETFTYTVPFPIADKTVLKNSAKVTCQNIVGQPDDESNNLADASTEVHTPVLTLGKTATTTINSGEAITYTITYQNTGSADAKGVIITDTLPKDVYYSIALDLGAGPKPGSFVTNSDGTTTLTWTIGALTTGSGMKTITYTARPSLLFLAGSSVTNKAVLDFTDRNGNDYPVLTTKASTAITAATITKTPLTLGYYRTHPEVWTTETLARIQATDTRFDGADTSLPDGKLSSTEMTAIFAPAGNQPKVLLMQLLATDFNLATRQINAGTSIKSKTTTRLGLTTVRSADMYAMGTLKLPVTTKNMGQYSDATTVLDEINNGKSEVY